jgi:hypothetical protein
VRWQARSAVAGLAVALARRKNLRGRKKERVKGEASGGWHGGLEGHCGLTDGATANVQMPWHAHTAALICGRSVSELQLKSESKPMEMTDRQTLMLQSSQTRPI